MWEFLHGLATTACAYCAFFVAAIVADRYGRPESVGPAAAGAFVVTFAIGFVDFMRRLHKAPR